MSDLITKTAFARLINIKLERLNELIKQGYFAEAIVDSKINKNHPAAKKYIEGIQQELFIKEPNNNNSKKTKETITLVSKTIFAKQAGTSLGSVSNAIKRGNLTNAVIGTKININHPEAQLFINRNKAMQNFRDNDNNKPKTELEYNSELPKETTEVEQYYNLSLREIINTFGTDYRFNEWLKAVKNIEDIKEKRIKNEHSMGSLISREFVRSHIFSLIETSNIRLLSDSPRTITARVLEANETGSTREQIEKIVCDLLSKQIKNIKVRAMRSLDE